ncbi:hypothetical protein TNCV_2935031 [Trichonephila clavipes]|nr:hypothetical protein TNCV_2935031 [Trichonephila clavipes]
MTQKGCQKYGKLNRLRRGGQPPQRTRNRPPKYNKLHVLTKNTIEGKYAILKRSFVCLSIGLNCHLEQVPSIIFACFVLHNLCICLGLVLILKLHENWVNLKRDECILSELAERWTELPQVSDESRSFFRVHTGYFSNIPKCIKAEFIASWACSQSSVVSSSQC